ncbi:hypothetical protein C8J56DRAFT_1159757, partial [Mycena floridula]
MNEPINGTRNSRTPDLWIELEVRFWGRTTTITPSLFDDNVSGIFEKFHGPVEPIVHAIIVIFPALRSTNRIDWPWNCSISLPPVPPRVGLAFHKHHTSLNPWNLMICPRQPLFDAADPQVHLVAEHVQLDTALGLLDDLYQIKHHQDITRAILD